MLTSPNDLTKAPLDIPVPPDATDVSDWTHGPGLAQRPFIGAVREVSSFVVGIAGIQRENRTCVREVIVEGPTPSTRLRPEAVRQLSAALSAAADEIEARA